MVAAAAMTPTSIVKAAIMIAALRLIPSLFPVLSCCCVANFSTTEAVTFSTLYCEARHNRFLPLA